MSNILDITSLYKSYSGVRALNGLELHLGEGKIVGLLGPNGCGKTTLLKCLAGVLTPESGEIRICGKIVGTETKSLVSYLPDKNFLCEWMTIAQMINYVADFFKDFRISTASEMLSGLGLDPNCRIKSLSKGNKDKVALIIAMSRNAKLYLLDEPIAGVDPAAREYIIRTIIGNYSEGSTILISTHLIRDIEPVLSDYLFIGGGKIFMSGPTDEARCREGKSIDELFREVFRC